MYICDGISGLSISSMRQIEQETTDLGKSHDSKNGQLQYSMYWQILYSRKVWILQKTEERQAFLIIK